MSGIPPYVRTTGLANWNRYAAVNDEFIDIHMDDDAAKAVGMPGVFGMGNLRIAYLHNLLADWLGDDGDIVDFRCEFRGLNMKGDTLTCTASPVAEGSVDGLRTTTVDLSVKNQDDIETTPGQATVVHFEDGKPAMPSDPPRREPSGDAAPGTFLQQDTIDQIGRTLPPVAAPSGRRQRHRPLGHRHLLARAAARRATSTPTRRPRARGAASWRRATSTPSPGCPTAPGPATGSGAWAPSPASASSTAASTTATSNPSAPATSSP